MKKKYVIPFLVIFLMMSFNLVGKDIVVNNPTYKVSSTGITTITKIELTNEDTKLHIHSQFIPNWWVKFDKDLYIEDNETKEKIYPTDIINGEFDKEIYMPASGDSTFILVFPPLDKKAKTINYHAPENTYIYDISLDPDAKQVDKSTVPDDVQKWIDAELANAKRKDLVDLESDKFFLDESARLVGYIKGYDPRLGFSTAMIYLNNEITRENLPTVIQIHPDGRFEANLTLKYPQLLSLSLERALINFFIEPGHTLSMVLDWGEFLLADRYRDKRHNFTDIVFQGSLAQVNKEILQVESELAHPPFMKAYNEEAGNIEPLAYRALQDEFVTPYEDGLQKLIAETKIGQTAATILTLDLAVKKGSYLYEYMGNYMNSGGDKERVIPKEFYSFLQDIPYNDHRLLSTSQFSTFINRLEYSDFFRPIYEKMNSSNKPAVSFDEYLFDVLELEKSEEDKKILEFYSKFEEENGWATFAKDNEEGVNQFKELSTAFNKKYEKETEEYVAIYIKPFEKSVGEKQDATWQMQDSILKSDMNIETGFLSDLIKSRSINSKFENAEKKNASDILQHYNKYVSTPFLKSEAQRLFDKKFSSDKSLAYALPEGKGTDIIRNITEPFKGKYVLIDFWATWCGPCVHTIKETKNTRNKYADHPEIAFVFVSDEKISDRYTSFLIEQEMTHSYNISEDDFKYLRELFRFNGIPHYVLMDKEGKILNDDFAGYNLVYELNKLLNTEKDLVDL